MGYFNAIWQITPVPVSPPPPQLSPDGCNAAFDKELCQPFVFCTGNLITVFSLFNPYNFWFTINLSVFI
jgi:hypothetical protein